jgi:hypothetical protein
VLWGAFDGVPADALVVSARSAAGPEFRDRLYLSVGLFALAALGGGALCRAAGHLLGTAGGASRRRVVRAGCLAMALLAGLPWAALVLLTLRLTAAWVRDALGAQGSPYFAESLFLPTCGTLVLAVLALPLGGWLAYRAALARLQRAS